MSDHAKVYIESTVPLVQFYKIARSSKVKKNQFDPHVSPPDIDMAKKHGQANRVCQYSSQITVSQAERLETCACCGLVIKNQEIPIRTDLKGLAHLGVTFPLYFQFIKKCSCLLMVQFLLSSFYNLYLNLNGSGCEVISFVCQTSIVNQLDGVSFELGFEGITNLVTLVVLIIFIEFFRVHQEISRYEIEKHKITPGDFTIQISGFHSDIRSQDIQHFLKKYFEKDDLELCGVYLLLDMESYSKKYKEKLKLIKKINVLNSLGRQQKKYNAKQLQQYEKQVFTIDEGLKNCESTFLRFAFLLNQRNPNSQSCFSDTAESNSFETEIPVKFSGRVLVTFNNAQDAKQIVKYFKLNSYENIYYWCYRRNIFKGFCKEKLKKFKYQDSILRIKKAAEPSDINWMNVGSSKMHQKLWISLAILGIFCLSCFDLSLFKVLIKKRAAEYSELVNIAFSLGVSTVVALTNTLIGIIIRNFAGKETHKKQTNYFVSVGKRLSYLFFINMVVTTMVANLFYMPDMNTTGHFRLIAMLNDYFFLFITNTYLSSIFNYFDIMWGVRLLKRYFAEKKGIYSSMSQSEANQLFEGHPVDMALRYANVMKVMFFTAAVSPFLPIGLPLSIMGLMILYWVDKYLLLRRYVCKNYLDKQLAKEMANILPLFAVFFSCGNILINVLEKSDNISKEDIVIDNSFYLALMGLVISLLYKYVFTLGDFKKVYQYIFNIRIPEKKIENSYQQYKPEFISNYEQFHPVLKAYQQEQENNVQQQAQSPELFKNIRVSLRQQE